MRVRVLGVLALATALAGTGVAAFPEASAAHASTAAPSISSISPSSGLVAGGSRVTIHGHGFSDVSAVRFGSYRARSFRTVSSTEISAVAPAHGASTVDVTVTAHSRRSATHSADGFRYYRTSCAGLPGTSSGSWVWTAYFAEQGLATDIRKLVCSAASGSTIRIKSWFVVADGSLVTGLLSDLRVMHTYHHVTVQVLVGRNGYTPSAGGQGGTAAYNALRRSLAGWASLYTCPGACYAGASSTTVTHSKYILVSNLAGRRGTAMLSTGANLSTQQLTRTAESGLLNIGNTTLYNAFARDWQAESACALRSRSCAGFPSREVATTSGGTTVSFTPTHGPTPYDAALAKALAIVRAQKARVPGCVIEGISLWANDPTMYASLSSLKSAGCTVRLLLEHEPTAQWLTSFAVKGGTDHDKVLTMTIPGQAPIVLAGSHNFTRSSNRDNEQTVQTTSTHVVNAYRAWFARIWNGSHVHRY